jgi:hypothetical protein
MPVPMPTRFPHYLRRKLERLGPYQSLFVVAIPLAIAEPLKLVAVFVVGDGHFIAGILVMACCYAVSLFVTERLFIIVKPKLLKLRWFATIWRWFVTVRDAAIGWLRRKWARGRAVLASGGR